jgi:hypothetical protein
MLIDTQTYHTRISVTFITLKNKTHEHIAQA